MAKTVTLAADRLDKTTTVESLLGVLSLRPMSGYEMRQFMERATSNFWSESYGQIYPALKKMTAEGLVRAESKNGEGHPAKKVYQITPAGRRRLTGWLGIPVTPRKNRNELLLKLFFGRPEDSSVLAAQVEARRARYASDLERYLELERQIPIRQKGHPGLPFFLMTVRFGITEAKALLTWCEQTLIELHKMDAAKGRQYER